MVLFRQTMGVAKIRLIVNAVKVADFFFIDL